MARDEFPRAVRFSRHAVGWVEEEVDQWIAHRIERNRVGASAA
jgi:predicted DNA-binding transcriptional regulator AlpA